MNCFHGHPARIVPVINLERKLTVQRCDACEVDGTVQRRRHFVPRPSPHHHPPFAALCPTVCCRLSICLPLALRDTRLIGILCLFVAVLLSLSLCLSLSRSLTVGLTYVSLICIFFIGANNDTRPVEGGAVVNGICG